jgi:hypothetical protein
MSDKIEVIQGTEWPRVAIALLTGTAEGYPPRTDYVMSCIRSIRKRLVYPTGALGWYVADDGSPENHFKSVMAQVGHEWRNGESSPLIIGQHSERMGPGPSWNRAIQGCLEWADIILWLEDDWELGKQLHIGPYVRLLLDLPDVGMVRMGYMAIDLDLYSVGHKGNHYLRVRWSTPYQYSGNPSLRHRRFFEFYDGYPTDPSVNPGNCEVAYDQQVRDRQNGPQIWWPISLGGWSVWGHVGERQSY